MSLDANISLCYKSCFISLYITLLNVFEVYKTKRNRTFAKSDMQKDPHKHTLLLHVGQYIEYSANNKTQYATQLNTIP